MTAATGAPPAGAKLAAVAIDGFDDEGRGRGTANGWDIAVRGALPGDVVDAVVERSFAARTLVQARCVRVLQDGGLHADRTCGHEAPCAACPLHGVDPALVLETKRARIAGALADAGLAALVPDVGDVVCGSGRRQKIKLTAGGDAGALVLGMYVPHSHALEDATACGHVEDALVDACDAVFGVLNDGGVGPDVLKAVVARVFQEGVIVVLVTTSPLSHAWPGIEDLVHAGVLLGAAERVDERGGNSLVGGHYHRHSGRTSGTPLLGGPLVHVDAFCQADAVAAARLVDIVCDFLVRDADKRGFFVDAYAGAGAFAQGLLSRGVAQVTAIECAGPSMQTLQALPGVVAMSSTMELALSALAGPCIEGLVLDPPKKGLAAIADDVAALHARKVALVSCDADAGARDLKCLLAHGYQVVRVFPVDLFPGSTEVEMVTLLALRR